MENLKTSSSLYQVSEIQLSYHPKLKASTRPSINSSRDVYNILKENWDEGKEDISLDFLIRKKSSIYAASNRTPPFIFEHFFSVNFFLNILISINYTMALNLV